MEFLGMQPRDVYVLCEFSRTDLQLLETALNNIELTFDGSIPEEQKAADYLVEKLYPKVQQMLKQIEEEYGAVPDTKVEDKDGSSSNT